MQFIADSRKSNPLCRINPSTSGCFAGVPRFIFVLRALKLRDTTMSPKDLNPALIKPFFRVGRRHSGTRALTSHRSYHFIFYFCRGCLSSLQALIAVLQAALAFGQVGPIFGKYVLFASFHQSHLKNKISIAPSSVSIIQVYLRP